uniref:Homing endonuclease LAGLIDADG domain-containing protein n=1 Tax=Hypsizygus marmoreus TaxID=39966 RepID=A0A4P8D2S5_HYPMA|nr:hypothetical protein [Hypsizygus marmoreus]
MKNILSGNLHSVLIGIMLGDGHIYKTSPSSNSRFEMSFGKDRIHFAHWVGGLFSEYLSNDLKVIKYKTNNFFNSRFGFRLKTKTLPIFNYYHDIFYEANNLTWKYKKIVPKIFQNLWILLF